MPSLNRNRMVMLAVLAGVALAGVVRDAGAGGPYKYYAVTPCRVADTRGNGFTGQYGPPAVASGGTRAMVVGGQCGVPVSAAAVVLNVSVINMTMMGDLKIVPAGAAAPPVASITWMGTTGVISNGALVGLGTGGAVTMTNEGLSSVDVIVDVNGYFQ